MLTGYVGSYSQGGGEGIYSFCLDENSGILDDAKLFSPIKNSKYIVAGKDGSIYSVYGEHNNHGVAICANGGEITDAVAFDPNPPCHIAAINEDIYTANYSAGTVARLSFINQRLTLKNIVNIGKNAGCHQVIDIGGMLAGPALLFDKLYILDYDLNILGRIPFALGSGPRHGVLSTDKRALYLVTELSNELYCFKVKGGRLTEKFRISILPKEEKNVAGTAAIRLCNTDKSLLISTRAVNLITSVNIGKGTPTIAQHFKLVGDHPRDILNVADDKFLLVANRYSDELLSLRIEDGVITEQCSSVKIPQGVSILVK